MTQPQQGQQLAEQTALAHARQQAAIRAAYLAAIMQVWYEVPQTNLRDIFLWWWGDARDRIYTGLAMGQESMAAEASDYVFDSLTLQGYDADVPDVDPTRFAGIAADGRELDTLLDTVVFRAWRSEQDDEPLAVALGHSEATLRTIAKSEMTDAGREADGVALVGSDIVGTLTEQEVETYEPITPVLRPPSRTGRTFPEGWTPATERSDREFLDANDIEDPWARRRREESLREAKRASPVPVGWIRMLTPPSCGRCAILAGRWYGWNEGFQRHPACNCRHIPAPESSAGDLTVDPRAYFDSLPPEEQDRLFGVAASEAIRDGADIAQVINAQNRKGGVYTVDGRQYTREGTTRRGYYGGSEAGERGERRMTPVQIYREAGEDREEARRLLRRFGYLS